MKHKNIVILIIFFLLSPLMLFSEPRISINTKYYFLYSTSQSELRREMNRKGIRLTDGKTYDGFTTWSVKWDYKYSNGPGFCILNNVDVSVNIEYTLPKCAWRFIRVRETRRKWLKYVELLEKHEHGHGDLGISAARDIEKALLGIGSRPRCDSLDIEANSIAYRILNGYRQKDAEYDSTTGHGRTQGVVFP
jgi:predicted secreted Zn-dependent protease